MGTVSLTQKRQPSRSTATPPAPPGYLHQGRPAPYQCYSIIKLLIMKIKIWTKLDRAAYPLLNTTITQCSILYMEWDEITTKKIYKNLQTKNGRSKNTQVKKKNCLHNSIKYSLDTKGLGTRYNYFTARKCESHAYPAPFHQMMSVPSKYA